MKKLMMLAAGPLASLSLIVPAAASAAPEIESKSLNESKSVSFTTSGGHSEIRGNTEPTVTCTSNQGSAKLTSKTTGEIELTFKGCTTLVFTLPVECHSVGQASGVITIGTSTFHTVYVTDSSTTAGLLLTPPTGGHFTTITCSGLSTIELEGNGVIGDLASPKCGASSTTGSLKFTATGSVQTYKSPSATAVNGVFNLVYTTAGGVPVEAALVAEATIAFAESVTLRCP